MDTLPKIKSFTAYEVEADKYILKSQNFTAVQINQNIILPFLGSSDFIKQFPCVHVDMGAVKFVCNGARIMRPGITKFDTFKKDDIVIVKDGPADKAGIHGSTTDQYSKKHGGDVITAIDGHAVTKIDDLISYLEEHVPVGKSITFTVHRNGQSLDLKTTLTARPSPLPFLPVLSSPPSNPYPRPPSP